MKMVPIVRFVLSAVAVSLLLTAYVACQNEPPTVPTITNVNTNTNVNNIGQNGPATGASPAACQPVGEVRISAIPGSLGVGDVERIDATPRDVNRQPRTVACDEASGAQWSVDDARVCTIGEPTQFVTTVKGVLVGTCRVTVEVDGFFASASFPVN